MPSPDRQSKPRPAANEGRTAELQVGDAVAYSRAFLRSIGAYTGDMPHAKGEITGLKVLSPDVVLADVSWDRAELPARVNVKNLCRVGSKAYHD